MTETFKIGFAPATNVIQAAWQQPSGSCQASWKSRILMSTRQHLSTALLSLPTVARPQRDESFVFNGGTNLVRFDPRHPQQPWRQDGLKDWPRAIMRVRAISPLHWSIELVWDDVKVRPGCVI